MILLISNIKKVNNDGTIYAKVIQRTFIRNFLNENNRKSFTALVADNSGMIEIIFINELADKFDAVVKCNELYKIKNYAVRMTNPNYQQFHPFEIMADQDLSIDLMPKPQTSTKSIQTAAKECTIVDLKILGLLSIGTKVDVRGLVTKIIHKTPIKAQSETLMKSIEIADSSGNSIRVSLYSNLAFQSVELNDEFLFKNFFISDFRDCKVLASKTSSSIERIRNY